MKKYSLFALFALLSASNAIAVPITISIDYNEHPSWVENSNFSFSIFKSESGNWPDNTSDIDLIDSGGTPTLNTGLSEFDISLPVTDMSSTYIIMSGSFEGNPDSEPYKSIFVAEPPDEYVSDWIAWEYGPPWISMAGLGPDGFLTGDLYIINGYDSQADTSHPWVVGEWTISSGHIPVPEPNTALFLFAGFLSIALAKKINHKGGSLKYPSA